MSTPFAYLAIDFESIDGQEHAVEIYSDISAGTYRPYRAYNQHTSRERRLCDRRPRRCCIVLQDRTGRPSHSLYGTSGESILHRDKQSSQRRRSLLQYANGKLSKDPLCTRRMTFCVLGRWQQRVGGLRVSRGLDLGTIRKLWIISMGKP